jgi:hypothetical protein
MIKKELKIVSFALILIMSACSNVGKKDKFSYNLVPVQSDEKWGYIDKGGKYVINPQFKFAYLFSDGLALVKSQDDKYGYIGEDGKFIINPTFKYATVFSEGLAFVTTENGFPTCIDKSGNIKFALKDATWAGVFNKGIACIEVKDKFGFIDNSGKIVINPQFDGAPEFSEELAAIFIRKESDSKDALWGYIDKTGKMVINTQFKGANLFSEGKALVSDGKKYGYIDKKGLYVINPQFDDAADFSEGLAAIKQGDVWGFINAEGKIVINPHLRIIFYVKMTGKQSIIAIST